ncbi:MAG: aminotransferase class V-fold PLP-dependent enzyme [Deltaproteobacteria bacterium]|nr:aminotransferase class V-fold PLP-dependent enzyme [Deltaproteobacteria bacterium]MBT7154341.1 aminotransferase class V-fold PLP-dependent enzyme [Deltaproteobacteria bacterium]
MKSYDLKAIRSQIIGRDLLHRTPFGERNLFYSDYTASGRGLAFIEEKMINILKSYANTHTEDDYTGKYMTRLLHQAEAKIKRLVNAGEHGKIIAAGSGATGALLKLQQILGIYIPPVTRERFYQTLEKSPLAGEGLLEDIESNKPVIFVSPYEHHTNELMWRESFAEVVVIKLDSRGMLDLDDLEARLASENYTNKVCLASFSAGSNITGLRTEVYDVARICHRFQTPVMFDFAAIAPYVEINMNRDSESYFDAVFFSPHKFLGGPGTSGILIFNENLYRNDLPPTAAGGGTVDYVGYHFHDFIKDIETREKAGTPPILQTIKAALVMDLKERIGIGLIEEREHELSKQFFKGIRKIKNVELVGNIPDEHRIPIISFNIRHQDRFLHSRFVTRLLNDLFGIQTRAGCSCAGPYGHYLLGIGDEQSAQFREQVQQGHSGIKPGWVRVNLHYTFEKQDIDFILDAIGFVAQSGHLFLKRYHLDMTTADWQYVGFEESESEFSIDNEFQPVEMNEEEMLQLDVIRKSYFSAAEKLVQELRQEPEVDFHVHSQEIETIKFFYNFK